jgi:hypothetical protein
MKWNMEPKPGHFKIFLFFKSDVRNLFLSRLTSANYIVVSKLGVISLI